EDSFLGPAHLLVAPGAAEGDVEPAGVERLPEACGLPHFGVQSRAVIERVDAARLGLRIAVDDQAHPGLCGEGIAEAIELAEFPPGVDGEEGEGRPGGEEG